MLEKRKQLIARKDSHKEAMHLPRSLTHANLESGSKLRGTQHNNDNQYGGRLVVDRTPMTAAKETKRSPISGQKDENNLHYKSMVNKNDHQQLKTTAT